MYDITSGDSFNRAKAWVRELQRQGSPNMIMALAGVCVCMGACCCCSPTAARQCCHVFCATVATAALNPPACLRPPRVCTAGNKADLEASRAVSTEEATAYATENGLFFMETSAKTAANVNEVFTEIARKLPKAEAPRPGGVGAASQPGIVLDAAPAPAAARRVGSCC